MKLRAVSGIMLTLLLIGMLTLAFNIQTVKSEPTKIIVPDDYEKIQWAIGNASDGDTIFVRAGTYYENVTIDKSISLVGENKCNTIIDGSKTGTVVLVTADNVNINGFTIGNSMKAAENGHCIHLEFSDGSTISGNIISSGPWINWYGWLGILLDHSNYTTVRDNLVYWNYWLGIKLHSSRNNIIVGNNITDNGWGIELGFGSSGNTIICNTISRSFFAGITGYVKDYANMLPGGNTIHHNNFIDNGHHVEASVWPSTPNTWDTGYPSGGNYWSGYKGNDTYSGPYQNVTGSDGIGDTPYFIDANNTDHYPLMYPWVAPPPPSYTLTIYGSPTGVTFSVDGMFRTTPWSGNCIEGSSVSLVMPAAHEGYVWYRWSDGETNRIKTVTMNTNITLTGVFTYVSPPPVGGKAIPINMPIVKPELQIPWTWLTTIILSFVATVVYVKLKKKKR